MPHWKFMYAMMPILTFEDITQFCFVGGQKTLKTLKPAIILEAACEETADREIIADQLRKLNYKLVGIVQQEGIIECSWSQYINMKDPFDPTYPVNVLFLPQIIS